MADEPAKDATGRARRGERGFILVAVLWILAALATLASIYAVYADNAAFAAHVNDDRLRVRASAQSATELAAYAQLTASDDARPAQGAFDFSLPGAAIHATFVTEGARIDLNGASKELLAGLFASLGADADQAAAYAAHVVAWRKNGVVAGENAEADAYKAAGYAYAPRQAPFRSALELYLVRGIPASIVAQALPHVTIFSGRGEIDVRAADFSVLSALPKVDPEKVQAILAQRGVGARNSEDLLKLLGPARAYATATTNPAIRVRADIRLDNGREARTEIVILVTPGEDEPFRVLSWRDDMDGPL